MIAKRIQRKSASNGKGLLAYVIHEKDGGRGDPTQWNLLPYVTDATHGGEKLAWEPRITGCTSDDVGWACKEMLATAALNTRSEADRFYHLVVSFQEDERPAREQMEQIEDALVAAVGYSEHMRISAVHDNTANLHLHVVIGKVHPRTHRNVEPYYDHLKLQEACAELEISMGLHRDNHVPQPDHPTQGRARDMEAHAKQISFIRWVKERGPELTKAAALAESWADLHREFHRFGVIVKPRGAGLIVCHIENERLRIKASDLNRSLASGKLTDRLGPYQPPVVQQDRDPDEPPPWLDETPPPSDPEQDMDMPPTWIDEAPPPEQMYEAGPIDAAPEVESLWSRYVTERDAARQARKAAMDDLRRKHFDYANELTAWYSQRHENAKMAHLNRGDRISTDRVLKSQQQQDMIERRQREKNDRIAVKHHHPVPTWMEFLDRETKAGNEHARTELERCASCESVSIEMRRDNGKDRSGITERSGDAAKEIHR